MSVTRAAQEFWLRRAAEVRKSIAQSSDLPARQKLEKLAAEYESLAERGAPPAAASKQD